MPWSRVLTFNDPIACQAALLSAPQSEILPTARGSFQAGVTQIGMNKLRMQRFEVALPQVKHTLMTPPDRKVVGFLVETSLSNLQHCGLEVTPYDIFVYGHGVQHQRSASDFHYATMSLPETDFHTLCKAVTGNEFLEAPRLSKVRPDPALMARLRKLHKVVGQLADDTPGLLEQPEVGRAFEEHLIHIMVRCLAEGAGVEPTTSGRRHRATMVRLEGFLEANLDRPLYLTEICTAVGVAERTLRSACEEHLGMGPIRYLTLRRMHLARRALLRADPSKATVTRIVTDLGFWELGRFSVTYRALFGETPSETLRHPAEHVAINHHRNHHRPSSLPAIELFGA